MSINAYVLDVFRASTGVIVVIGFKENIIPDIGRILKNDKGYKWRILGRAQEQKYGIEEYKNYERAWPCKIEPIEHSETLTVNEILKLE